MNITNPPNVNLSQVVVDAGLDLSGGDYDIAMKVGRTIDGKDVSTLDVGDMLASTFDPDSDDKIDFLQIKISLLDTLINSADKLTVAIFQTPVPTGDFANGVDNLTNTTVNEAQAWGAVINQYIEVDFGADYYIKQYRISAKWASHNADGSFKIQYWNGSAWVDWETGIPTLTAAAPYGFGSWVEKTIVYTSKIRFICTAVDTGATKSICNELEIKY